MKDRLYTRMMVGETLGDAQTGELVRILGENLKELQTAVNNEQWTMDFEILAEEGGAMVVVLTTFRTREDALRFHSSRGYRTIVQKTQHLLAGDYVVKLFENRRAA